MRVECVIASVSLHITENRLRFRLIVIPEENTTTKTFAAEFHRCKTGMIQKTQQVYWGFHLQVRGKYEIGCAFRRSVSGVGVNNKFRRLSTVGSTYPFIVQLEATRKR